MDYEQEENQDTTYTERSENMESRGIAGAVAVLVGLLAIAGVVYMQSNKAIKNMAIDGCYRTAQIETKQSETSTLRTPENYWFTECLKKKGYNAK